MFSVCVCVSVSQSFYLLPFLPSGFPLLKGSHCVAARRGWHRLTTPRLYLDESLLYMCTEKTEEGHPSWGRLQLCYSGAVFIFHHWLIFTEAVWANFSPCFPFCSTDNRKDRMSRENRCLSVLFLLLRRFLSCFSFLSFFRLCVFLVPSGFLFALTSCCLLLSGDIEFLPRRCSRLLSCTSTRTSYGGKQFTLAANLVVIQPWWRKREDLLKTLNFKHPDTNKCTYTHTNWINPRGALMVLLIVH